MCFQKIEAALENGQSADKRSFTATLKRSSKPLLSARTSKSAASWPKPTDRSKVAQDPAIVTPSVTHRMEEIPPLETGSSATRAKDRVPIHSDSHHLGESDTGNSSASKKARNNSIPFDSSNFSVLQSTGDMSSQRCLATQKVHSTPLFGRPQSSYTPQEAGVPVNRYAEHVHQVNRKGICNETLPEQAFNPPLPWQVGDSPIMPQAVEELHEQDRKMCAVKYPAVAHQNESEENGKQYQNAANFSSLKAKHQVQVYNEHHAQKQVELLRQILTYVSPGQVSMAGYPGGYRGVQQITRGIGAPTSNMYRYVDTIEPHLMTESLESALRRYRSRLGELDRARFEAGSELTTFALKFLHGFSSYRHVSSAAVSTAAYQSNGAGEEDPRLLERAQAAEFPKRPILKVAATALKKWTAAWNSTQRKR
ncbi:MAG: hypothetical protein M4579_004363 [Chaenotheca gracillima]|nr:MAG: hypothetical protein M4579_004363 [Chaenotheca gracillima]